jgi:hypothetical protein
MNFINRTLTAIAISAFIAPMAMASPHAKTGPKLTVPQKTKLQAPKVKRAKKAAHAPKEKAQASATPKLKARAPKAGF